MIHLVLFKFTPCDLSEVCHSSNESILKSSVIIIGLSARLSLIVCDSEVADKTEAWDC